MAKRKKKAAKGRYKKCQVKVICGKRRRICRDAKGRIRSNTPAGRR